MPRKPRTELEVYAHGLIGLIDSIDADRPGFLLPDTEAIAVLRRVVNGTASIEDMHAGWRFMHEDHEFAVEFGGGSQWT